jgi:hypothetical protein
MDTGNFKNEYFEKNLKAISGLTNEELIAELLSNQYNCDINQPAYREALILEAYARMVKK